MINYLVFFGNKISLTLDMRAQILKDTITVPLSLDETDPIYTSNYSRSSTLRSNPLAPPINDTITLDLLTQQRRAKSKEKSYFVNTLTDSPLSSLDPLMGPSQGIQKFKNFPQSTLFLISSLNFLIIPERHLHKFDPGVQ